MRDELGLRQSERPSMSIGDVAIVHLASTFGAQERRVDSRASSRVIPRRLQTDPELARALQWLQSTLDSALFTPGHTGGRPLRFNLVPPLAELAAEDQQALLRAGAQTLAHMLKLKQSAADDAKRALLLCALEFYCKHHDSVSVGGLIALLDSGDPSFSERAGVLYKEAPKLLLQLKSFEVMNQELLSDQGEPLDTEYLLGLGPHARPNKTRLAIVSTRFFDSEQTTLSWVAQMIAELNRYAARKPAASLQALVMFDEADIYLPAMRQPATEAPMESLLKRARSAGIGVMLATQSPGPLSEAGLFTGSALVCSPGPELQ